MVVSTESRDSIVEKLKRELIGPDPFGERLDFSKTVTFKDKKESYKSFVQQGSGDEVLQRDSPLTRYGAAILYARPPEDGKNSAKSNPKEQIKKIVFGEDGETLLKEMRSGELFENELSAKVTEKPEAPASAAFEINSSGIPDLASANKFLPHSMGVTFLAEIKKNSQIVVNAAGGRYHMLPVKVENEKRTWWGREKVQMTAKFNDVYEQFAAPANAQTAVSKGKKINYSKLKSTNAAGLDLTVEVYARPAARSGQFLITVLLVNRTKIVQAKMPDLFALFQAEFSVRVVSPEGNRHIVPYALEENVNDDLSCEEQSIALLYRDARTFAVGHGCAADWDRVVEPDGKVKEVTANHFPTFDVPRMSSEVKGADGQPLEISMAKLAGLVAGDNGIGDLSEMVNEYDAWIIRRDIESLKLDAKYRPAAQKHLAECRRALERMRDGLKLLSEDERAREAFRLTNHAILIQQLASRQPLRRATIDSRKTGSSAAAKYSTKYSEPNPLDRNSHAGTWRAFQIAFLLTALRSAIDPDCPERETVDLIWFATAGGKTEAYLSLTAFTVFYRRLLDPQDAGTTVFMRYTLRLLTAQQFQRAGALICAMEILRRRAPEKFGDTKITIGLWLGNDVTPGTRHDARRSLQQLEKHPRTTDNKFILNRCPYCAAELGKIEGENKGARRNDKSRNNLGGGNSKNGRSVGKTRPIEIAGYKFEGGQVVLHCPDGACPFFEALPIYVSDEQVYENRPTLFIATVDKFAVLARKSEARALFGLDKEGMRVFSPPSLIIQDELHLISGPLGTMVGLYEAVVEELCTDRRVPGKGIKPKIVASTATTRAYREQILNLYAREDARLFPPAGLSADNSFFARYARGEDGRLLPGRLYVGVSAPGLGSVQNAEVRVYTALLQAANQLAEGERNWYWTLMAFFNNLKWLGNTVSLFQANLPAYFLAYQSRSSSSSEAPIKSRRIKTPLELTGQLSGDEVLSALKKLEIDWTPSDSSRAIDACLCSSLAEVGVDVGRLSLMAVVGQPKSTAQYIQVTSRVGRDVNHPGLIVTIFSPLKARDQSHFEKFRSYHERLYAQVEPTSLTPFSPPALERALHAVVAAFVRQTGTRREALTPHPVPTERISTIKNILLRRLEKIAPEMRREFEKIFDRRIAEWHRWQQTAWWPDPRSGVASSLLRSFDRWISEKDKLRSWATPISMRSVDAESELRITDYYCSRQFETEQSETGASEENLNITEVF